MSDFRSLKRKEEHLMCFIFAELGTTGNQDAGGQLILKGKVSFIVFQTNL